MTPLHQVGPAGLEEQVLGCAAGCMSVSECSTVNAVVGLGGGPPSTARLGYPISSCTSTREKIPRQVAVKFSLDTARTRTTRSRAMSHARREFHGPQIPNVSPGFWTFTNIVLPSGAKHAPANSRFFGCALRAIR